MGPISSPQRGARQARQRAQRRWVSPQVVVGLIQPPGGVVDVEKPASASRDAVRPPRRAAQHEVGVDVHGGEHGTVERQGQAVVPAEEGDVLEPAGQHPVSAELGKGEVGLVQRGHDGRFGEGVGHGEHDALGTAALGEIVVGDHHPWARVPRRSSQLCFDFLGTRCPGPVERFTFCGRASCRRTGLCVAPRGATGAGGVQNAGGVFRHHSSAHTPDVIQPRDDLVRLVLYSIPHTATTAQARRRIQTLLISKHSSRDSSTPRAFVS